MLAPLHGSDRVSNVWEKVAAERLRLNSEDVATLEAISPGMSNEWRCSLPSKPNYFEPHCWASVTNHASRGCALAVRFTSSVRRTVQKGVKAVR